jgi:hypothetical protein
VDSSSSSEVLAVFPDVIFTGGSIRESAAEGMTGVSWVEEDGLTMSAEGVGSYSGMGRIARCLNFFIINYQLIDSITVFVFLLNTL